MKSSAEETFTADNTKSTSTTESPSMPVVIEYNGTPTTESASSLDCDSQHPYLPLLCTSDTSNSGEYFLPQCRAGGNTNHSSEEFVI